MKIIEILANTDKISSYKVLRQTEIKSVQIPPKHNSDLQHNMQLELRHLKPCYVKEIIVCVPVSDYNSRRVEVNGKACGL